MFNLFAHRMFRAPVRKSAARPSSLKPQVEPLESRLTPAVTVVQTGPLVTITANADADVVTIDDRGLNRFSVQSGADLLGVKKIQIISTAGIDVNYTGAAPYPSHLKLFDWKTSDGNDHLQATALSADNLNIKSKATEVGDDSFSINSGGSYSFFENITISTGQGSDDFSYIAGLFLDIRKDLTLTGNGELDVTMSGTPKYVFVQGNITIKANNLLTTATSDIHIVETSTYNGNIDIQVNTDARATAATNITLA